MSKCGYCGGFTWELYTESPNDSAFKINFIRCSHCKVPIGTMEFFNLHSTIEILQKKIEVIESLEQTNTHTLEVINENIRRLFHK